MKRNLTILSQIIVVIIGMGIAGLMLWEPHLEGRNVNATIFEIYFKDPFLTYAYVGSIPFFIALSQVFKILRYVRQNNLVSETTIKALSVIRYCAITLIIFILGAEVYIFTIQRGKEDDIAGGVAMGIFMIIISVIIATVATVFAKSLQNTIALKNTKST